MVQENKRILFFLGIAPFRNLPADHVISCFINLVGKCVHMLMDGVLKSGCQSRYKQKLEPVGLQLSCVPYLESNSHRD